MGRRDLNNPSINELVDYNYGTRIKSGDNTTLKYILEEGDLEDFDLEGKEAQAVLKYENLKAYEIPARLDTMNKAVYFHISEALAPSQTPYVVEIVVTDPTKKEGESDYRRIFPSDNEITLQIVPSSVIADDYVIENAGEKKLKTIVLTALSNDEVLNQAKDEELKRQQAEKERTTSETSRLEAEQTRVANENQRKTNEVQRVERM